MNSEEAEDIEALNQSKDTAQTESEQPSDAEVGLGQLLCNQREILGLSVQEVANRLHLTMHYVRAIESDAHEKLPSDVFVRGYLRTYAKLLGLDSGVIVDMYNDYAKQRQSAELEGHTRRRRRRRRNKNMPWIIISGIAFIAMAILLWYFSTGSEGAARTGSAAALDVTDIDELASTRTVTLPVPSALTPAAPSNATLAASLEPVADAVEAQAATANPTEGSASERVITVDTGGADSVQIRFTGASMVQIDDASDAQLYRDMRVAGDVLRINGTAPFNILLGDASKSELSFNGTQVDFSSSIRIDNSARLTIGL